MCCKVEALFMTPLAQKRQDLSCTSLAHHELESDYFILLLVLSLLLFAGTVLRNKLLFSPTRLSLCFVFVHMACVPVLVFSFAYILIFSACEFEIIHCRPLSVKLNKMQRFLFSFPCCVLERGCWGAGLDGGSAGVT